MDCDCKESFEIICKSKFDLEKINGNMNVLEQYPMQYHLYYAEYINNNIISRKKNDKKLYEYLNANKLLNEEICYYKIAKFLTDKIIDMDWRKIVVENNDINATMDYLYWTYGNPNDSDNFLRKKLNREKNIIKRNLKQKYKEGKIKYRTGQEQYRKDLINIYKECQLCGMENNSQLVASHIKSYKESELDEAIDFNNGFLLCKQHDGLFDRGLITINDEGELVFSPKLSDNDRILIERSGYKKIDINKEQKKYLDWHRKYVFKK